MFIWLAQKLRTLSNPSYWPSPSAWWMRTFAQQRSILTHRLLPASSISKKAILNRRKRQSFAAMSQQKEGESSSALPVFASRASAEDDDGQDVRDLLSKHKACVYMPQLPQSDEDSTVAAKKSKSSVNSGSAILGLSGSLFPKANTAPPFNVFHQLGARPFNHHAAAMDQTINLDDTTTQQMEDIDHGDDDIIVLPQSPEPESSLASRQDSDEVVIIEEKRPRMFVKVPAEKSVADGDRTVIVLDDCVASKPSADLTNVLRGAPPEMLSGNADQQKIAENGVSETFITRIANEYGEMSMDLDSEMNSSTSSDSTANDAAAARLTSLRTTGTVAQSLVKSIVKDSPKTYQSPLPQTSNWAPHSSKQLHTSAGSLSASADDDVTFLLERKKASFASKSGTTTSGLGLNMGASTSASGQRPDKDEQVRDLISAAYRASGYVRSWESCRPPKSPPLPTKNVVPLTVCSYNVLCQQTIGDTGYLYRHLSDKRHLLDWSHRSALLRKELAMLDADIFCLQEVQADHYDDFYLPLMRQMGYDGYFKKRTGEKVDGCATFWRTRTLQMCENRSIEYYVEPDSALDRDNVGMIVTLMVKGTETKLLVANTHLLFNQNRGDVKLAQLAMLFAHLEQMSYTGAGNSRESMIICGDFNMEPLSPIYEFVVVGGLKYAGVPQGELSGQGRSGGRLMPHAFIPASANVTAHCLLPMEHRRRHHPTPPPPPNTGSLLHQFKLMSVYRHKTAHDTFELSTYHSKESAMPDFIFYSLAKKSVTREDDKLVCRGVVEGRLKCVRRLALPDQQFMDETVGRLPNERCPSDHLPLLAEFLFDTS